MQHSRLVVPRYQRSEEEKVLVVGWLARLLAHLPVEVSIFRDPTSAASIPRSVISAKVKLALRCRSTFSEYTRVLSDRKGSPVKKSVSPL